MPSVRWKPATAITPPCPSAFPPRRATCTKAKPSPGRLWIWRWGAAVTRWPCARKTGMNSSAVPAAAWKNAIRCGHASWPTPLPRWPAPAITSSSWGTASLTWTALAPPSVCMPAFPRWASPAPSCWIPKRAWRSRFIPICSSRKSAMKTPLSHRRRRWMRLPAIPCWWWWIPTSPPSWKAGRSTRPAAMSSSSTTTARWWSISIMPSSSSTSPLPAPPVKWSPSWCSISGAASFASAWRRPRRCWPVSCWIPKTLSCAPASAPSRPQPSCAVWAPIP